MSRRVKLVTEWATWEVEGTTTYLQGKADYVVVIFDGEQYCVVYAEAARGSDGWIYGERVFVVVEATIEATIAACEQKLLEVGLIDPLWYVSQ